MRSGRHNLRFEWKTGTLQLWLCGGLKPMRKDVHKLCVRNVSARLVESGVAEVT